ncbi:MAG: DUF3368 domain-containing protein [Myxococcales bacterium]|nr:DUF3368 domain-containing protein [Myxococcales bacterium]
MALLVSDANIFIDFEDGGLLDVLFGLDETIGVPDLLFEDELRAQHWGLLDRGLVLIELSAETVERVTLLATRYRHPSRLDLAALAAAQQEMCALLTGDRHLRRAAEREGVEVHGTLWLAERLVVRGLLSVSQLSAAYRQMRARGRRLPWDEVGRQLARLTSS